MSNATDRQLAEAQCNGYDAPHMGRMADECRLDEPYEPWITFPRAWTLIGLYALAVVSCGLIA